jgi:hypothetical protein
MSSKEGSEKLYECATNPARRRITSFPITLGLQPHPITSPHVKDVTITQQFVCQLRSQRHIEVCALQDRHLEDILVKEGQAVKAGGRDVSMVENYRKSIEVKKRQLTGLDASVNAASKLFGTGRVEYIEALHSQRDQLEARMVLIETKRQQLSAVANAYQALGGGDLLPIPAPDLSHFYK